MLHVHLVQLDRYPKAVDFAIVEATHHMSRGTPASFPWALSQEFWLSEWSSSQGCALSNGGLACDKNCLW